MLNHPIVRRSVVLKPYEVQKHMHFIGKSGSGKSTALASLIVQLINQGVGTSLIDPQGDLAMLVMRILRSQGRWQSPDSEDYKRIVYLDFSHPNRVPPMNVLRQPRYMPDDVSDALADVCLRVWPSLEGVAVTFLNIIKHAAWALINAGLPLTAMQDFLEQPEKRREILSHSTDEQVLRFFANRYDQWKDQDDKRDSTLNRADLFTFSPRMRAILGANDMPDLRSIMDAGTCVIYNLAGLNRDQRKFIGAFVAYGYERAASSREEIPEETRRLHMLYMDEFALFSAQTSQALEEILSGARKYRLFLGLAHQNFGQTDTRLKQALQNAEEIAFQLNRDDAVWMAPRLAHFDPKEVKHEIEDEHTKERSHPVFSPLPEQFEKMARELEDLPVGHCYMKFGSRVQRLVTTPFPKPKVTYDDMQPILEKYAHDYLIPFTPAVVQSGRGAEPIPIFSAPAMQRRVVKGA